MRGAASSLSLLLLRALLARAGGFDELWNVDVEDESLEDDGHPHFVGDEPRSQALVGDDLVAFCRSLSTGMKLKDKRVWASACEGSGQCKVSSVKVGRRRRYFCKALPPPPASCQEAKNSKDCARVSPQPPMETSDENGCVWGYKAGRKRRRSCQAVPNTCAASPSAATCYAVPDTACRWSSLSCRQVESCADATFSSRQCLKFRGENSTCGFLPAIKGRRKASCVELPSVCEEAESQLSCLAAVQSGLMCRWSRAKLQQQATCKTLLACKDAGASKLSCKKMPDCLFIPKNRYRKVSACTSKKYECTDASTAYSCFRVADKACKWHRSRCSEISTCREARTKVICSRVDKGSCKWRKAAGRSTCVPSPPSTLSPTSEIAITGVPTLGPTGKPTIVTRPACKFNSPLRPTPTDVDWPGKLYMAQTHVIPLPRPPGILAPELIASREAELIWEPADQDFPSSVPVLVAAFNSSSGEFIGSMFARSPEKIRVSNGDERFRVNSRLWTATLPWKWIYLGVEVQIHANMSSGAASKKFTYVIDSVAPPSKFTISRVKIAVFGNTTQLATLDSKTHAGGDLARGVFASLPLSELEWVDPPLWHLPWIIVAGQGGIPILAHNETERRQRVGAGATDEPRWELLKLQVAARLSMANQGRGTIVKKATHNSPYAMRTEVAMGYHFTEKGKWDRMGLWQKWSAAGWTGWTAMRPGDECGNTLIHELGHSFTLHHFSSGAAKKWGIADEYPNDGTFTPEHPPAYDSVRRKFRVWYQSGTSPKLGMRDPMNGGESPTSDACFPSFTPYHTLKAQRWLSNTPVLFSCERVHNDSTSLPKWEISNDGSDIKSSEFNFHAGKSLDDCKAIAAEAGVKYFAWTKSVYGGGCKVLKKSVSSPDLTTHQGYGYKLWENVKHYPGCGAKKWDGVKYAPTPVVPDGLRPISMGTKVVTLVGTMTKRKETSRIYPPHFSIGNIFYHTNPWSPSAADSLPQSRGAQHFLRVSYIDGDGIKEEDILINTPLITSDTGLEMFSVNLDASRVPSSAALYRSGSTSISFPDDFSKDNVLLDSIFIPQSLSALMTVARVGKGRLGIELDERKQSQLVIQDRCTDEGSMHGQGCTHGKAAKNFGVISLERRGFFNQSLSTNKQAALDRVNVSDECPTLFSVPITRKSDGARFQMKLCTAKSLQVFSGDLKLFGLDQNICFPPPDATTGIRVWAPFILNSNLPVGTYESAADEPPLSITAVDEFGEKQVTTIIRADLTILESERLEFGLRGSQGSSYLSPTLLRASKPSSWFFLTRDFDVGPTKSLWWGTTQGTELRIELFKDKKSETPCSGPPVISRFIVEGFQQVSGSSCQPQKFGAPRRWQMHAGRGADNCAHQLYLRIKPGQENLAPQGCTYFSSAARPLIIDATPWHANPGYAEATFVFDLHITF